MKTPDKWVIVDCTKGTFKVFGMWCGGYLDGDSWNLNSGIKSMITDEEFYTFNGYSGSQYKCFKSAYGVTAYGASVLNGFPSVITVLEEDEWYARVISKL